jgi:hypothetical protein
MASDLANELKTFMKETLRDNQAEMMNQLQLNNQQLLCAMDKKIDDKFAALDARLRLVEARETPVDAPMTAPATPNGFAPPSQAAKRLRPDFRDAQRAASAPPTKHPADPCRVWISGFPRPLLGTSLRNHAQVLLAVVPLPLREKITVKAYNLDKQFSLLFPTAASASDFITAARALEGMWTDPKDQKEHKIYIKPDRSIETRHVNKVLGHLWKLTYDKVSSDGNWKDGFKMGSSGPRGTLFISHDEDVHELFKVKYIRSNGSNDFTIEPVNSNLAFYNIDPEIAQAFVEDARTVVMSIP